MFTNGHVKILLNVWGHIWWAIQTCRYMVAVRNCRQKLRKSFNFFKTLIQDVSHQHFLVRCNPWHLSDKSLLKWKILLHRIKNLITDLTAPDSHARFRHLRLFTWVRSSALGRTREEPAGGFDTPVWNPANAPKGLHYRREFRHKISCRADVWRSLSTNREVLGCQC